MILKEPFTRLSKRLHPLKLFPWIGELTRATLLQDVLAGLTLATVIIPQSMAYSILAELPPQYGLYTAVYPVVIFALVGSSRTMSVGPFAITSILLGSSLAAYNPDIRVYLAMIITFWVGVLQLFLALFKLGRYVDDWLLNRPVTNGFVAGSCLHIMTSQIFPLLQLQKNSLVSWLPQHWADLVIQISNDRAHWPTFGVGLATLVIIWFFDQTDSLLWKWIDGKVQVRANWQGQREREGSSDNTGKATGSAGGQKGPVSAESMAPEAVGPSSSEKHEMPLRTLTENQTPPPHGTADPLSSGRESVDSDNRRNQQETISTKPRAKVHIPSMLLAIGIVSISFGVFRLDRRWGVKIIDFIPQGLPAPEVPFRDDIWPLLPPLIPAICILAIVGALLSFSISRAFSDARYPVDLNMDLIGLGLGQVVGSFFFAHVASGGLARTVAFVQAGALTPLGSLVSVIIVLLCITFLTGAFRWIPYTALAGLILYVCTGLLRKVWRGIRLLPPFCRFLVQWHRVGLTSISPSHKVQGPKEALETLQWWATFLAVVFVDIKVGVAVGVASNVAITGTRVIRKRLEERTRRS